MAMGVVVAGKSVSGADGKTIGTVKIRPHYKLN